MPRQNVDYSKTVIYKIVCDDENVDFIYVGSTTNFTKRKCAHKNICNNINDKKYNQKKYVQIRENGGWENFKMIEVEKYPCNDNRESEKREEEVRLELKANMNMIRSFLCKDLKTNLKQEYDKTYRKLNETKIKEDKRKYYEKNKKQIYDKNENKMFECECGSVIKLYSKYHHLKTKNHIIHLEKKIGKKITI